MEINSYYQSSTPFLLLLLRNEAPMAQGEYRSPKSQTIVDMNYTMIERYILGHKFITNLFHIPQVVQVLKYR